MNLYDSHWQVIYDGNGAARELFDEHYSRTRYADGRTPKLFVGPGQKMVLKTRDNTAIFAWRKFIDDAIPKQTGVNCAIFRNEGDVRSSQLILEAEIFARLRWPTDRLYTYVDDSKIKSANPGCCFLKAGWQRVRDADRQWQRTRSGKLILEKIGSG